ncbi:hypothetical protein [Arthrobacter sp. B6]|uniref:hypothetical protein n=1 Tax=Arthrobacter sp. B6 TaxID=1570137 RepID=UPI000AC4D3BC|nr:hypothetical protein [Arthrobacter sp. B6]
MSVADSAQLRWYDYVLAEGTEQSELLWTGACREGQRVLLICGSGFDPRTLDTPRRISAQDWKDLSVLALRPGASGEHEDAEEASRNNAAELRLLFGERLNIVSSPTVQDPNTVGTVLSRQLQSEYHVLDFDTVIVDMSGLPSSISFTVLQLLLQQSLPGVPSDKRFDGNLLVTVSEDVSTDERIIASGLGSAGILAGFARLPDQSRTCIWVPVLGSGASEELRALATLLEPDEVCPVIPFPSRDPRRGDDLVLEHRVLLIDELQFEPRNVLYASETNPFDLYRQLVWLAQRYRTALEPLGGATVVVSEHTSKILSLGVLLAAHEAKIVIGYVRPMAYQLVDPVSNDRRPSIYTAWLTGEPYA